MPTYEYRCSKCEHEMEEFQSITAKPLRKCPACGKNTLQRLIGTGAGVVFKGSGFWQTDYARSGDYKKSAEADSKPAENKSSDSKSNDSKSDAKSGGETKAGCGGGCACDPAPAAKPRSSPKKSKKAG